MIKFNEDGTITPEYRTFLAMKALPMPRVVKSSYPVGTKLSQTAKDYGVLPKEVAAALRAE